MTWLQTLVCLTFLGVMIFPIPYQCYLHPYYAIPIIAVIVLFALCFICASAYGLKEFKRERMNDSICTFVRTFERRSVDTWILRAVYEELSFNCGVAVRRTDPIMNLLGFCDEELDDMAEEIAYRAGRSMEDTEKNPYLAKVNTVEDLVMFFQAQPKVA